MSRHGNMLSGTDLTNELENLSPQQSCSNSKVCQIGYTNGRGRALRPQVCTKRVLYTDAEYSIVSTTMSTLDTPCD